MNKETTASRLKHLMKLRNLRQVDILNRALPYAELFGIKLNKSDISQYVSGKVEPGQDKLFILGEALNVSPAWLLGYDIPMNCEQVVSTTDAIPNHPDILPVTTQYVPLLGDIACGEPIYAEENLSAVLAVGAEVDCDFALRCRGDSMIGARIYDGDIVFIKKQDTVMDGEIAAVILDDDATLKRVYRLADGRIELRAENPMYKSIIVGGDAETRSFHILGKAVAFQSRVI
ncbi:MAG: repressor LexA [Clostridiales bacterium]|nr:repressor LexA [Clostridiales bacterium]